VKKCAKCTFFRRVREDGAIAESERIGRRSRTAIRPPAPRKRLR